MKSMNTKSMQAAVLPAPAPAPALIALMVLTLASLALTPAVAQVDDYRDIDFPELQAFEIPRPETFELDNGLTVFLPGAGRTPGRTGARPPPGRHQARTWPSRTAGWAGSTPRYPRACSRGRVDFAYVSWKKRWASGRPSCSSKCVQRGPGFSGNASRSKGTSTPGASPGSSRKVAAEARGTIWRAMPRIPTRRWRSR